MIRYPCTGHVRADGFGAYLEAELGEPRRNLRAFARDLAALFEAEHVTLVNSGSSANLVAACALAERTGKRRALVPAFTFPTTVSALRYAGFTPTFIDVAPGSFHIDPARVIEDDVGVVALTHFLGFPSPIPSGALILQDACETMAMRIAGEPIARLADVTTFSFYHPHHLSSFGGGAVIARDPGLARVVESLSHWGRACTHHVDLACDAPDGPDHFFHYVRDGLNVEMSELNACFGRWSLRRHDDDEAKRALHYAILREGVGSRAITYPAADVGVTPFVFPITIHENDARPVIDRLFARGVEARSLMGGVIADQPAFSDLPREDLPVARDLARRSFFVGIHHTLATDDVRDVARVLGEET
jgi:CDP-6-deoxy-D-xylo-4-hexulose-3-dehydrase